MANALFDRGREGFLAGDIDWDGDNIKEVYVDHGTDTPVPGTDEDLADIIAGARVSTSGNLASKTVTDGTADAADTTHTAVTGATVESVVEYQDTGVEATSLLIAFIDTASSGLPLTPNGGDVVTQYNAAGIFTL